MVRILSSITLVVWAAAMLAAQTNQPAQDLGGPYLLTCSPAPCVLTPVQASPGPKNSIDAPIAVNPVDAEDILVGSNSFDCGLYESLAFYPSRNGGSSWNNICMSDIFFDKQTYTPFLFPILAYDHNGAAYIAGLYGNNGNGNPGTVVGFEKSTDGGLSWPDSGVAVAGKNADPGDCWMAADTNVASPYVNSIYVSCVMVGPPFKNTQNQVVVSHSNDGGATWHVVNVAPVQNSPELDSATATAVGTDGIVYISWVYCVSVGGGCDNNQAYLVLSQSNDGGNTWSEPKRIARVTLVYYLPNTESALVAEYPAIAVDTSDGPHSGNLYAVMYNWTGTFMQVVVARSTDGGDTWSKPLPVAPGVTHDQFLPWIAVSPTGLVGVTWLDRRNDPSNIDYQAFAGISVNGGLDFQPNIQLTATFSSPKKGIDEYNGAVWDGPNYFLATWEDIRNVMGEVNTQAMVGGIRLK